jgi:hypothetical protein
VGGDRPVLKRASLGGGRQRPRRPARPRAPRDPRRQPHRHQAVQVGRRARPLQRQRLRLQRLGVVRAARDGHARHAARLVGAS